MKRLHLTILVIFLIFIGKSLMAEEIKDVIDSVQKKVAPDKRVAVFNVNYGLREDKLIIEGELSSEEFHKELIQILKEKFNYEIIDRTEILPSKKLGTKIYGIVNLSVCNIRSAPEHSAELSTQALLGTPIKVLKEKNGWYLIQTPDFYIGWVDDDGIYLVDSAGMESWNKAQKIIYLNIFGFVYSDVEKNQILSDIVAGGMLKLKNKINNFYEVEFSDGRKGFIPYEFAKPYNEWIKLLKFDSKEIISFAEKMIGFPYLWGGTSIKGVDCSGFIKTIYFFNGMILPRDASQQAEVGHEISFENDFTNLQPGDLIFFGRKKSETLSEKITHVGMYLGDKKFIHSSGRVRIDSFDENDPNFNEFRLRTIVKVKRILDDKNLIEKLKIVNNPFYNLP